MALTSLKIRVFLHPSMNQEPPQKMEAERDKGKPRHRGGDDQKDQPSSVRLVLRKGDAEEKDSKSAKNEGREKRPESKVINLGEQSDSAAKLVFGLFGLRRLLLLLGRLLFVGGLHFDDVLGLFHGFTPAKLRLGISFGFHPKNRSLRTERPPRRILGTPGVPLLSHLRRRKRSIPLSPPRLPLREAERGNIFDEYYSELYYLCHINIIDFLRNLRNAEDKKLIEKYIDEAFDFLDKEFNKANIKYDIVLKKIDNVYLNRNLCKLYYKIKKKI